MTKIKPFSEMKFAIIEMIGLGQVLGIITIMLTALILLFAVLWFVDSAPPNTITLIGGPEDSMFQLTARKYEKILARSGVKLNVIPSQGSLENLAHLSDCWRLSKTAQIWRSFKILLLGQHKGHFRALCFAS